MIRLVACLLSWVPRRLRLEWWRYWQRHLHPAHPGHIELRLLILDLESTR